jgi:hypothetical protein
MSDILSRLEAQAQDFSNIAQRGEEMVQGFDSDRLIAEGQTLAYNMGKAQLSTLIGAETVAGLTHGVPVFYKTGKAIAQRLQGMPTTKEEALARAQAAVRDAAQKAGRQVGQQAGEIAQRVESTAQPLVNRIAQETTSGAAGDLKYDVARGVPVTATGEDITDDRYDSELQTLSGERGDPVLRQARLERLSNPADPPPSAYRTVPERQEFPDLGSRSFQAPTESAFRAETEARRVAAQASSGPPPPPEPSPEEPIPSVAESEANIGSYVRPGTSLRVDTNVRGITKSVSPKVPRSNRFADTGEPAPAPPPRDAPGGPEAPGQFDDLFPAPPEATQLPTPAVPVDAQGRELPQQAQAQANALSQQDDDEAELQSRLKALRVQDGDGSGGAQPTQEPTFKEDEDNPLGNFIKPKPVNPTGTEPPSGPGVLDDITKAELDTAPEQEIADAIPGLGEIIGGAIGLGSLIAGVFEGGEGPSKAPQQPPGIRAMQTAYDSSPVINSDDYHAI